MKALCILFLFIHSPFLVRMSAGQWNEKINPFKDSKWTRIGNLPQSPNYFFGVPIMHFSAVDLFQKEGTSVYAVNTGEISVPSAIDGKSDWVSTLQILGDDGILSYYMHLDPETIPVAFLEARLNSKSVRVKKGEYIGKLMVGKGSLKPHLHFGMADCKRRVRLNPMKYLDITDTIPPTIECIYAEKDGLKIEGALKGKVDFTTKTFDKINESNEAYPPNRLEFSFYSLKDSKKKSALIFKSALFDATEFPFRIKMTELKSDEKKLNNDKCENFIEFDGYAVDSQSIIYRGLLKGDKVSKEIERLTNGEDFLYALTFEPSNDLDLKKLSVHPFLGKWNTAECNDKGERIYPDGKYKVSVRASDINGNQTRRYQVFTVKNSHCEK